MAVGQVSSTNYDNWQLIATNTTTSGTTSSFTGLTGYKKYLVTIEGVVFASNTHLTMTFNSSTANYVSSFAAENQSSTARYTTSGTTNLRFTSTSTTTFKGSVQIDNILAGPKLVTLNLLAHGAGGDDIVQGTGFWNDTAAITQINFTSSGGSTAFTAGTISLYGIAA
jgi:hypothetical protein